MYNFAAIKGSIDRTAKVVQESRAGGEESGFLNLRNPYNWDPGRRCFTTDVRWVIRDGTNGMAHCVVHPGVGRPTGTRGSTKSILCPRCIPDTYGQLKEQAECDPCELLKVIAKDPVLAGHMMDFPERGDTGVLAMKRISVAQIVKKMELKDVIIMMMIEPKFHGCPKFSDNTDVPKDLQGFQMAWLTTKTVWEGIMTLIDRNPPGFFADPAQGYCFRINFYKDRTGSDMYEITNGPQIPFDPALCLSVPDAATRLPQLRKTQAIQGLLQAMLPGICRFF